MEKTSIKHIAFIMDGNRRWARQNLFTLFRAHNSGAENIEPIVEYASYLHIPYLTFWAFSTENWRRPQVEVKELLEIMRRQLKGRMMRRLKENKVRIVFIGDISRFPEDIREEISSVMQETKQNTKITVSLALNYGGRQEILHAIKQILKNGEQEVTEESFRKYLYANEIPDPDLIIRTGGEQRLSGFLSWQSIYSELYFTKTLWPDFSVKELEQAIAEYAIRQRRFGS